MQDRTTDAAGIERTLGADGAVLVVGRLRGHYYGPHLREHPRIIFWDSTDQADRPVPERTRAIICLRSVSHSVFGKLQRYATKNSALLLPGFNSDGEVRVLLEQALHLEPERRPVKRKPAPLPIDPEFATGRVRRFIEAHAQLTPTMNVAAEARRLFALPDAQALGTTLPALQQSVHKLRKRMSDLPGRQIKSEPLDSRASDPTRKPTRDDPPFDKRTRDVLWSIVALLTQQLLASDMRAMQLARDQKASAEREPTEP